MKAEVSNRPMAMTPRRTPMIRALLLIVALPSGFMVIGPPELFSESGQATEL
jgi:hypothetical protein